MKPTPIPLPPSRITHDSAAQLFGIGNADLLAEPLLGFIASRECPGHALIETLERVPQWAQAGRVIVSGFHSPLERQVLASLLRRQGRAVKVLARGITDYRPTPEESEPIAAGRMLVISAYPPAVTRTTRATSLERNRLVLALAAESIVPFISDDSPLRTLIRKVR